MTFARWLLRVLQPISPAAAAWLAEHLFFTARRSRLSKGARAFLSSGQRFTLDAEGRRVVGWRWGQSGRDSSPVVYLVHGWGSRGARLAAFVEPLVAAGYEVVMYDAPGNGASARGMTSMPEYARALAAVVAQDCGRSPHAIVGHSLGCAATALALSWGLEVRRLVFLAPAADPPAWVLPFSRVLGLRPNVIERVQARSERRLRVRWNELNVCDIARNLSHRPPLLIVHDEADETVRYEEGSAIAGAWPESRLITTRGLGHRGVTQAPNVVRESVDFLIADGRPVPEAHTLEYEMFNRDERVLQA